MKEKISLIYKMIIVLVSGYALYLNFKLLTFRQGILYFTNISNLLCFIYFTILVIKTILGKPKKDSERSDLDHIIKGVITMAITLTFFMYNFYLRGTTSTDVFIGHDLETNLVHVVVPLLVMLDYAIFGEKGYQKKHYPLIWSTILIAYQVFVVLYVALGGRFINNLIYPYPYMDTAEYGIFGVVRNMIVIYVIFVGYGTIIQTLDNKFGKKK